MKKTKPAAYSMTLPGFLQERGISLHEMAEKGLTVAEMTKEINRRCAPFATLEEAVRHRLKAMGIKYQAAHRLKGGRHG